jgi:hypothetical protein
MDAFAQLGLPRRASLSVAEIQAAYFSAAKDQPSDSATLHEAYDLLLHPEKRLRHLLEIAAPPEATEWRTVPMAESLMQLFLRLGRARSEAEALAVRREKASSALSRALMEKALLAQRDDLECIGLELEELRMAILHTLAEQEGQWQQLALAQAQLSYLAKWQAQIAELLLRLM